MKRHAAWTAAFAAVILACAGCVHSVYYLGERKVEPPSEQGIWVDAAAGTERGPHDADLQRKIRQLLADAGYRTVSEDEAGIFLFYEYTVDSILGRIRLEPHKGSASGLETVRREGPFEHSLSLWLVDAAAYREKESREEVLWLGGAKLAKAPTESDRFADLLLVAAFKEFPAQTEGTLKARLRLGDARARRLRTVGGG
jgi:hypothetical protein